jgi:hypothetical protein
MTLPSYPGRERRPGGRWSTPGLVAELLRLTALERAVAHVAAGWTPKVAELDDKLRLATIMESSTARASAVRREALTLLERDDTALTACPAWIEPLRTLDASGTAPDVVRALTREVPTFLTARYRDLAGRLDPLLDQRLLGVVTEARDELAAGPRVPRALARSLDAAWRAEGHLPLDAVVWPPVDRVPVPARPAGRPRPETGARAHLRVLSRHEPEDIAGELNDNVMAEVCALELIARSSYEHHDMPWSFHVGAARHAADEARHAAIFRRLLSQYGFSEHELPQHGSNYEYAYEFPECGAGSRRELAWRLLILCTVLEALAIDKLPLEIAIRDTLGQLDFARALDYASVDELFHTENGLRWTRRLCSELQLDPMIERELVHGRFFGRQRDLRAAYLAADPLRAAREIGILEGPDPDGMTFQSRTERELRTRASFTEAECDQVDRWGYNPRSSVSVERAAS